MTSKGSFTITDSDGNVVMSGEATIVANTADLGPGVADIQRDNPDEQSFSE
jgi:hypothetical protein